MSNNITHVIFDCDGTLINSVDLYPKFFECIREKLGIYPTTDKEDSNWFKNTTHDYKFEIEKMAKKFNIIDNKAMTKLISDCMEQIGCEVKLKPGVEKLMMHLHEHNIPMAVATGATKPLYDLRTKKFQNLLNPGNFISHVVCSGEDPEVLNDKPHPDVFLVCAKRFAKHPLSMRNALVIEDTYSGIQGAITAGMSTLFVSSLDCFEANQEECNYDFILQSLDQFQPQIFGLPPF